jgi:hypothetical protein
MVRPLYSACRLNDQTLRALAEAPAQRPADDPYAWDHRADTYLTKVKRFLFNVLLFLGSLPEEHEPDQVLRAAREKKGRMRPELRAARFLGKETYRPASRLTGAEHQPTAPSRQSRAVDVPEDPKRRLAHRSWIPRFGFQFADLTMQRKSRLQ